MALRRALQSAEASGSTFEEQEDSLVLGVGVGTFLVIMFFILGVLICGLGTAGGRPVTGFVAGATLFGIVTGVLFAAEREPRYVETEEENSEYSEFGLARGFLVLFMALSAIAAGVGVCLQHAMKRTVVPALDNEALHLHRRRAF